MLVKSGVYCLLCFITFTINGYKNAFYHRLLKLFIRQFRVKKVFRSYSFRVQVETRLESFIREHTFMCHQVIHGNQEIWSRMLFYFLCTNLPSNIYLLIHLFLSNSGEKQSSSQSSSIKREGNREFSLVDTVAIGTVFAGQTATVLLVLLILAQQCKELHSFARYVPALQQILKVGNGSGSVAVKVGLKLKYDLLLERLISGKRYGVSIGPLWTITYDTLCQVIFVLLNFC